MNPLDWWSTRGWQGHLSACRIQLNWIVHCAGVNTGGESIKSSNTSPRISASSKSIRMGFGENSVDQPNSIADDSDHLWLKQQQHELRRDELVVPNWNHPIDDWTMSWWIESERNETKRHDTTRKILFELSNSNGTNGDRRGRWRTNQFNRQSSPSIAERHRPLTGFSISSEMTSTDFSFIGKESSGDGNYLMSNDSWHSSRKMFFFQLIEKESVFERLEEKRAKILEFVAWED